MKSDSHSTRTYRQTARAKAAAETAERIVDAFVAHLRTEWFDEIRLEDVAREAEVTVQTVIRRFGGKDGLLEAASERMRRDILGPRHLATAEVGGALDALIAEYDTIGELVIRLLAQEDRHAAVRELTDLGRKTHREWVSEVFSRWLEVLPHDRREQTLDRLVIAFDIYVWKLLRIDMKRETSAARGAMLAMAAAALGLKPDDLAGRTPVRLETFE